MIRSHNILQQLDTDGNGRLNSSEIALYLRQNNASDLEIKIMAHEMEDEQINFSDFADIEQKRDEYIHLRLQFEKLDTDRNGKLDALEFAVHLHDRGAPLDEITETSAALKGHGFGLRRFIELSQKSNKSGNKGDPKSQHKLQDEHTSNSSLQALFTRLDTSRDRFRDANKLDVHFGSEGASEENVTASHRDMNGQKFDPRGFIAMEQASEVTKQSGMEKENEQKEPTNLPDDNNHDAKHESEVHGGSFLGDSVDKASLTPPPEESFWEAAPSRRQPEPEHADSMVEKVNALFADDASAHLRPSTLLSDKATLVHVSLAQPVSQNSARSLIRKERREAPRFIASDGR